MSSKLSLLDSISGVSVQLAPSCDVLHLHGSNTRMECISIGRPFQGLTQESWTGLFAEPTPRGSNWQVSLFLAPTTSRWLDPSNLPQPPSQEVVGGNTHPHLRSFQPTDSSIARASAGRIGAACEHPSPTPGEKWSETETLQPGSGFFPEHQKMPSQNSSALLDVFRDAKESPTY